MTIMKKHRIKNTDVLLTVDCEDSIAIDCNVTSGFGKCSDYEKAMSRKRGGTYEMH